MEDKAVYYAIGDVHGELDAFLALHGRIDRHHRRAYSALPDIRVHLGDYVDRGPDSAGVVEWLMAAQHRDPVGTICLKGNHEAMMVDAFRKEDKHREAWRRHGGKTTLRSYRKRGHETVPDTHLNWMEGLPLRHDVERRKLVFVHASIDPKRFPASDGRLEMWGRRKAFFDSAAWSNPALKGATVLHGHTPTPDRKPDVSRDARRVNVDTGAVYGGRLTAAVLAPGEPVRFLSVPSKAV